MRGQRLKGLEMNIYTLDCFAISSEVDFWDLYVRVVAPQGAGYFGRNLDAFNDALAGGPGWPGVCQITLINWAGLRRFSGGAFYANLCSIMEQQKVVQFVWEET
jgi:RNAse (barnase) inhibitor barstar